MHDLLALYRFALASGDHALAAALGRALRSDERLRRRADLCLQGLPRGPGFWSAAGDRIVRALLQRLASASPP